MAGTKRKAESTVEKHQKKSRKRGSGEDEVDDGVDIDSGNQDDGPDANDGLHPDRMKKVEANNTSSREAHAKQKQLVAERKAAKPLAAQLARGKKLWERLRLKSHVPTAERKALVAELFELVTGNVKDYVLKHDSVRVIQTAIRYATVEQNRMIANELKGSYRELAESKYAKFLIGKLLSIGDNEIRDIIVPEFFGHVRKLIKHPEASWILDDIYRGVATKQQKAVILREWYGAEFVLFQNNEEEVVGNLSDILEEDPGKRVTIMRSLRELINHLIQKKFTGFTLLHDAMLQYFLNAKQGTEELTDFLELLKGEEEPDLLKNLAFTKSGARLVCLALAHGTAKDRRQMLKQFKDTFHLMAGDVNAHLVILAAYEVIDDTVLTAKSIFPELFSKDGEKLRVSITEFANDMNARRTLLYLVEGRSINLFPTVFGKPSAVLPLLEELDAAKAGTSKKDPGTRRAELFKAIAPLLVKGVEIAAADLAKTSLGCHFITEVMFIAQGEAPPAPDKPALQFPAPDKSAALSAIAATATGNPSAASAATDSISTPGHLASFPHYGKMLRALISGGPFCKAERRIVPIVPPLHFADVVFPVIREHLVDWATGFNSFVVLALLESELFGGKEELRTLLKACKKELQRAAQEQTAAQKALKVARDGGEVKGGGRWRNKKKMEVAGSVKSVGNVGAGMILGKL